MVDCDLHGYEDENNPLYRCFVRKPYPLKTDGGLSFALLFPLDNHIKLGEFGIDFSLRTAEEDTVHVAEALRVPIVVDYSLLIDGYVVFFYITTVNYEKYLFGERIPNDFAAPFSAYF